MSDLAALSYEPLEPLRLSDVGMTGDNADTVIDAERIMHEVLPNKMAAVMFNKLLWGSSFEAWAEFNARIAPYFAQFSDIVYRNVMADNPYNSGKLMLKNHFYAKYFNPETKQTEEKDLAKSGFWSPWMVAERGSWGPDASRVVNTLTATGHPMARLDDGSFNPAFIDEEFPDDVDAEGKPIEGGRKHKMDKLFSKFNTFLAELLQAFSDGVIRDSIEYAKQRFKLGKKIAEAPKSDAPFFDKGAAEAVLRYYWDNKTSDIEITQELLDDLAERVKTALNPKNASFMTFPELPDPKSKMGEWATLPGTSSPARPAFQLLDGQHSSKEDDVPAGEAAGAAAAAAAQGGRKKTVTWKKEHAAGFRASINYKYDTPVSVRQSELYFNSQGLKTKNAKPLVTLLAVTIANGKPSIKAMPLSQIGKRHALKGDVIFRARTMPKVSPNDKGLELRLEVSEIQIIGLYSVVMSIGRPLPVPPIYSKGGAGATRHLALDDGMAGMFIEALKDLSPEDLAQLDAAERAYIEGSRPVEQKKITAPPPTAAKRPAPATASPAPPAKKAAAAISAPEAGEEEEENEEAAAADDEDLVE